MKGQCFCGIVKYGFEGPVKFVAHDHCSICRRISGAAFVTWVGVKESQFHLTSGESFLTKYRSSKDSERLFCSSCGSHLFFRSSRWEGEVHITLATVIDGELLQPRAHVFYSDRVSWCPVNDDLPKYGGESGTEPLD